MLATLEREFTPIGLNVRGIASPATYNSLAQAHLTTGVLFPETRSIIVVASGGLTLWERFVDAVAVDERVLTEQAHPLDAFVRGVVDAVDGKLGPGKRRWFFASAAADVHLDFRSLAYAAGLGRRSRMGLLMHPIHGLWVGLRAACFTDEVLPFDGVADGDPCADCPGHCGAACPGGALVSGRWDVDRCSQYHAESTDCAYSCRARKACPMGCASMYSEEECVYHYNRAAGRARLRARLSIPDARDRHPGEGPLWNEWRVRVKINASRSS